jgi:hypothetical protein
MMRNLSYHQDRGELSMPLAFTYMQCRGSFGT